MTSINEWGPIKWHELETYAVYYPDEPSQIQMRRAIVWIFMFNDSLPCDKCKIDMANYIEIYPPNVSSKNAFMIWVWKFHNYVNEKKKVRLFSWDEFKCKHSNGIYDSRFGFKQEDLLNFSKLL